MRGLFKFEWDCGRNGMLEGIFVADDAAVSAAIGKEVYFGDVLGKHSDVHGKLSLEDVKRIEADDDKIDWLIATFSSPPFPPDSEPSTRTIFGYNPLAYLGEEETSEAS